VDTASEASSRGQALNCVGTALQSQGRPAEALPLYREAAQLWANQPIVYFSIATAHKQLGQLEQALAALDEGMELDARCQSGLQGLLLSLRQSLEKEQQEAAGQQEARQLPEAGMAA
jgi:tetratricopeptide (TPR) repeat protein